MSSAPDCASGDLNARRFRLKAGGQLTEDVMQPPFRHLPHPAPTSAEARAESLRDPGFGRVFTDHMVVVKWTEGEGWGRSGRQGARTVPDRPRQRGAALRAGNLRGTESLSHGGRDHDVPARAQCAPLSRNRPSGWRCRLCPKTCFSPPAEELVKKDRDWVPGGEGSLYLRPFQFASEVFLGVKPASEYLFVVIASPVGRLFQGG